MKKLYTFSGQLTIAALMGLAAPAAGAVDISDEAGLRAIADNLAGEYTLTADITVSGEWSPLGSADNPFTGRINGNGHVIKGITYRNQDTDRAAFIHSAQGASITKLGLENVDILGNADAGGLLGKDMGGNSITECYVTGKISGRDHVGAIIGGCDGENSTVDNCYAIAYVHSRQYQAGGLVGTTVNVEITNSYFAGSIYDQSNCVGGIAALVDGGDMTAIANCFVASPMIIRMDQGWGAQARVLGNDAGREFSLDNNYALTGTLVGAYGQFSVPSSDDAASNEGADKAYTELTSGEFVTNTLGWDASVWTVNDGSLPRFAWQTAKVDVSAVYDNLHGDKIQMSADASVYAAVCAPYGVTYAIADEAVATISADGEIHSVAAGTTTVTVTFPGDATMDSYTKSFTVEVIGVNYNISTADDLQNMRFDLAGEYTLMNDIDLTDFGVWEMIGSEGDPFTGKLDGNGHVITGLNVAPEGDVNNIGMFSAAKGAVITRLGIENASVTYSNGGQNVAALVGRAEGVTISQCYVSNSTIIGRDHVASFVGGSYSGGEPTLIEDCYSTAYVQTRQYQVSGIMGTMINGIINRCHFSGMVVAGDSNAGGFVSLVDGDADYNTITNSICLAVSIMGNSNNSGRIVGNTNGKNYELDNNYGLSTTACNGSDDEEEATTTGRQGESVDPDDAISEDFYTDALGWDMTDTWTMIPEGFPVLAWQSLPVKGMFFNVPESITLIEGKGDYDLGSIKGNFGQEVDAEEIETNYLRIRASVSVKEWPATTTTTAIRLTSMTEDVECEVIVPVTLIPASEATIHISTPADLIAVAERPNLDYILDNDINMEGIAFAGIGTSDAPFSGIFDGNGYTVYNITRQVGNQEGGIFNYTANAVIKRLGVADVQLTGGNADIGGLIGRASSTSVEECFVKGYVQGNDHVGGIFGLASNSTISNSFFAGDVVTTGYQAGGIAGVAESLVITNCYAQGTSESTGSGAWYMRAGGIVALSNGAGSSMNGVAAINNVTGGIIGIFLASTENWQSILTSFSGVYSVDCTRTAQSEDCNADNTWAYEYCTVTDEDGHDWNSVPRAGSGDARTDAELRNWNTYAAMGWDATIWTMPEEGGYPVLINVPGSTGSVETVSFTELSYSVTGTHGAAVINCAGDATASIYNVQGAAYGTVSVNGTATVELPAGLYLIKMAGAEGTKTFKVVVR